MLFINKNCIIEYSRFNESDKIMYILFYVPDIYPGWYTAATRLKSYEINEIASVLYPYTYKGKLYEMRTADLYFGSIPRDILDEVIKYLQ
jgi:hypothetical protein